MKIYANLTNGISEIPDGLPLRCVRIQSSHCEGKKWDLILRDLDYTFLMDLASGEEVVVVDASHRGSGMSRAVFQGIPWIRFALERRWFNRPNTPFVKGMNVFPYFDEAYYKISRKTKNKLDYVKKFLTTDEIKLSGRSVYTSHDGQYDWYKSVLIKRWKKELDTPG